MQIDIRGKVAVVTGAGRGIGAVLARRFAEEGCKIAIFEREVDSLALIAAELRAAGSEVEPIRCDVSIETDVQHAVAQTVARFGVIDILINNAGVGTPSRLTTESVEGWDNAFAHNTRGTFLCTREVAAVMKPRREGRIINAASFSSIIPSSPMGAYAASKAAVTSMTRVFAAELAAWNITVNCYAPGMIPTRLSGFAEVSDERRMELWDTLCIARWGDPNEIADLCIFLASDKARYITGSMIDASGGKYAVQFPAQARQEGVE